MQPEQDTAAPAQTDTTGSLRLPCRGCLPDCPNYTACGGAPWRQAQQDVESL